jgi:hypothetical protein
MVLGAIEQSFTFLFLLQAPLSADTLLQATGQTRDRGACRRPGAISLRLARLVWRVVPHRPASRLPARDREMPPDRLVRLQRLSARAQAPPPDHQRPAGPPPLVPVPAPLRVRPARPLHVHKTIRTPVWSWRGQAGPYESSLMHRVPGARKSAATPRRGAGVAGVGPGGALPVNGRPVQPMRVLLRREYGARCAGDQEYVPPVCSPSVPGGALCSLTRPGGRTARAPAGRAGPRSRSPAHASAGPRTGPAAPARAPPGPVEHGLGGVETALRGVGLHYIWA